MRTRLLELVRFGSVGALAFVVDAGLFNVLMYGPGEVLGHKPLTAKVVSASVATLVAWLGNRHWTFPGRRRHAALPELLAFAVVNVVAMAIAVGCLAVSRYLMGLDSPLVDNLAANVVGLGLGTAFRYVAYRRVVFPGAAPAATASDTLVDPGGADGTDGTGVKAVATSPVPPT